MGAKSSQVALTGRLTLQAGQCHHQGRLLHHQTLGEPYDPSPYEIEVVSMANADGTQVPVTGNHSHDLVDWVTRGGEVAGKSAALYALNKERRGQFRVELRPGENVGSVFPHVLNMDQLSGKRFLLQLRVTKPFESRIKIEIVHENQILATLKEKFARPAEMIVKKIKGSMLCENFPEDAEELEVRVVKG